MKTLRKNLPRRGFTLMELMVAMAITTIIVTVLVSVTSIALDTWNRSRAELRAARQGKAMVETMARDFESLVTRRGNDYEWLIAESSDVDNANLASTNSSDLIFFTAATDRYDGNVGLDDFDEGGDVSCVGYRLFYRNPIDQNRNEFETFVLNRYLVNPDLAFGTLLGETDLKNAFGTYSSELENVESFVCENVFQFTLTFHVEVTSTSISGDLIETKLVTVGQSSGGSMTDSFSVKGTGIDASTADELASGRLTAVGISLTVLTDFGVDQIRKGAFDRNKEEEFILKNSYQYSKLVELPSM